MIEIDFELHDTHSNLKCEGTIKSVIEEEGYPSVHYYNFQRYCDDYINDKHYKGWTHCCIGCNEDKELDFTLLYDYITGKGTQEQLDDFKRNLRLYLKHIIEYNIIYVDAYQVMEEYYEDEEHNIKIIVKRVEPSCGYDVHDVLCGCCDKCGECGLHYLCEM